MQEIVERLKKNRDLEKARSIVESAGYAVSDSDDTVMEFASDEEAYEWAEDHDQEVSSMAQGRYDKACMAHLRKKREGLDEADSVNHESNMKSNPTFKRMEVLCARYGYKLAEAYIEVYPSGRRVPSVRIATDRTDRFAPDVYFYASKFGNEKDTNIFEIQTTSYGSLNLEDHTEFLDAVTRAHNMVDELSNFDLDSLYVYEESE